MSRDWKRPSAKYPLALIVLSALLLASCSPAKKTTTNLKTTTEIEEQTTLDREVKTDSAATATSTDALHIRQTASTKTESASDEEVVTTTREYDTDKPVDPSTGVPPLKRETTEIRRKVDAAKQEQTTDQTTYRQQDTTLQANTSQTDSTAIRSNVRGQSEVATQVKTTQKRRLNTIQRVLIVSGLIAVVLGLLWVRRKVKQYL
jgi:PBP1b-binding outer membrane lipoprotein LpoB